MTRLPKENTGRGAPTAQEFITKTTHNCKTQGPCAATAAREARLPIQARMLGCASASTSPGSTGPHLRSASGHRVRAAARAHHIATSACPSACRAWRRPISATCGESWRLKRPGTMLSWRRWRRFGLPGVASAYQRNMRRVLAAQEARYHAVLEEMETAFKEPPEPPEPPEAQGSGGS